MDQETEYLKKRMADLSRQAQRKGIVTFSNFLNLNELSILCRMQKELYSSFQASGGYEHAQRQMAAFLPDALYYDWEYPMDAVRIVPSAPKFAEQISHRDILGALMNLGLKREMLGDILMLESEAVVLCVDAVSSYIMENCIKIRHTMVSCSKIPVSGFAYEPRYLEKEGIVSSFRIDALIADICKLPRSSAQKIICEGNAFINSRKIQQNGYLCQSGDVLSVRHFGKFQIEAAGSMTKKGRLKYKYKIYL